MTKKYDPEKDTRFGIVLFSCPLLIWILLLLYYHISLFIIALTLTLFFLWIWFGTIYHIHDNMFCWRSGPFRKKIPINKIVSLNRKVRSWACVRPALTFEYLQIRYNKYDDVFIAPEDEEKFIDDIININPAISVRGTHKK